MTTPTTERAGLFLTLRRGDRVFMAGPAGDTAVLTVDGFTLDPKQLLLSVDGRRLVLAPLKSQLVRLVGEAVVLTATTEFRGSRVRVGFTARRTVRLRHHRARRRNSA